MAEFPALPLFTDAYLADTRHLTAAQHGAYLLLLMMAWRMKDCALPDDDDILARWASMDVRTWRRNKDAVLAFWNKGDDAKWRQGRLYHERKYVDDLSSKNSLAGLASALKRKERRSTSVPTEAQPNSNPHTHTHTHTPYNPLPPCKPQQAERTQKGSFLEGENGEGWTMQKVESKLNSEAIEKAKANAPGWDIYRLMEIYANSINERGSPRSINAAFPAWCRNYTKGNRP